MSATFTVPISHLDPPAMQERKRLLLGVAGLAQDTWAVSADTTAVPAACLHRARACAMDEMELYRWNPWATGCEVAFVSHWNELKVVRVLEEQAKLVSDAAASAALLACVHAMGEAAAAATTADAAGERVEVIDKSLPANAAYAALDGMLAKGGMEVGALGVVPAVFPDTTGRGLVFSRDVARTEPVVSVPRKLLFNVEATVASSLHVAFEAAGLDDDTRLLLFLVHEKFCAPGASACGGAWAPFVELLPATYDTLFFWSDEELAELEGCRLLPECAAQKEHLEGVYATLFPALFESHPAAFRRDVFTFENLLWARAVFDSRAFIVKIDGRPRTTLVPYAEYINHSCLSGHVSFRRFDEASQCMLLESLGTGRAGGQAFMNYGPMQNSDLLLGYGFAVGDNDNETFVMDLDLADEEDPLCEEKQRLVAALGIPADHLLSKKNTEYHYFMAVLRVMVCADEDELSAVKVEDGNVFKGPLSEENEERAVDMFCNVLDSLMSCYPTTLEEDEAALAALRATAQQGGHTEVLATSRREMALVYRIGQKELLRHAHREVSARMR
eukprot:Rhum_TRINITY_DN8034_c0_g1::Rhum_TRINITY_DN8034_c0_g1_i1::g.25614::m.25614